MTVYKPGDVVLVAFPFTNWSTLKQRPAVVISPVVFNMASNDIILCAITSHVTDQSYELDYLLNQKELTACGLPKPSLIKLTKIVTLDQRLVRKQLGALPQASLKKILKKFKAIFVG